MKPIGKALTKKKLIRIGIISVIFWTPIFLFASIADEIHEKENLFFDTSILQWIHQFSNPTLDRIVITITNFGGVSFVVALMVVLLLWMLYKRHLHAAAVFAIGVGGAGLINVLLKLFFARDRPALWDHIITETTYSFPSGHAMGSSALALCFIYVLWRTQYRWFVFVVSTIYIVLIGVSRLYLGVHYPSDVLGGWCVSLLWITLVHSVVNNYPIPFNRILSLKQISK